jgi:enoyl-CoA hydratase/carnithine racemase
MTVDVCVEGPVLQIVMNRPAKMNALLPSDLDELDAAWRRLEEDNGIKVATITGAGNVAFTAGADLEMTAPLLSDPDRYAWFEHAVLISWSPSKPVIAGVNGYCLGTGFMLLLGTDCRVASTSATFGTAANTRQGRMPPSSSVSLFSQLPFATAMDLVMSDRRIPAAEAQACGLIGEVVEPSELQSSIQRRAELIAAYDGPSLASVKALARRWHQPDALEAVHAREQLLEGLVGKRFSMPERG